MGVSGPEALLEIIRQKQDLSGYRERHWTGTFADYVETIHQHAYRVTDRMVAGLAAAGAGEDEVFEISVASAYGAARRRLDAGLRAVREARGGD